MSATRCRVCGDAYPTFDHPCMSVPSSERAMMGTLKKDKRQREIAELKKDVRMFLHGVFWRVMWTTHLAKRYSRLACRLGFYAKFDDGRCMYCGEQK